MTWPNEQKIRRSLYVCIPTLEHLPAIAFLHVSSPNAEDTEERKGAQTLLDRLWQAGGNEGT